MEINNRYYDYGMNYPQQSGTDRIADRTSKPEQTGTGQNPNQPKAENARFAPKDEYINREKSGSRPSGLYSMTRDEDGKVQIRFEDRKRKENVSRDPQAGSGIPQKPVRECTANTDRPDQEIRKLKEEKNRLEQQLRAAAQDPAKISELTGKLKQIAQELSRKDNDTYRKQHTSFWG